MAGTLVQKVLGVVTVASALTVGMTATAFASSSVAGTATLTGGSLSYVPPSTIAFSATVTGAAQSVTATQAFDVNDATGSGAGWNITVTSTQFSAAGGKLLPTASVTDTGATSACDTSVTCTPGNNTLVSYPVTVPAAATAPAAIEIQTAAATTGLAGQTWTHTMSLLVPAAALAGSYTSTWTYSLVSGP